MDRISRSKRSSLMANIKSKGNKSTELRLKSIFRRFGITGWRCGSKLIGKPDFVFPKHKLAVFVDGDFWHGHPYNYNEPKTNALYWRSKIAQNIARDQLVTNELERMGWKVLRFWESNLQDEYAVAARVSFAL